MLDRLLTTSSDSISNTKFSIRLDLSGFSVLHRRPRFWFLWRGLV